MITLAATNTIAAKPTTFGGSPAITYTIFGLETTSGVTTEKVLAQGTLTAGSLTTMYTVPSSTSTLVTTIVFVNTASFGSSYLSLTVNGSSTANTLSLAIYMAAGWTYFLNDSGIVGMDALGNMMSNVVPGRYTVQTILPTTPLALSATGVYPSSNFTGTSINPRTNPGIALIDHTHQSPGGVAAITAASSGINTTETSIVSATLPAGFIKTGTTLRIACTGTNTTSTTSVTSTLVVRYGAAGTSSDTALISLVSTATSGTSIPFGYECYVTFNFPNGSANASAVLWNNGTTGISTTTPFVATPINTTGLNLTSSEIIHLACVTSSTKVTNTFQTATIEVVKM